MKNQEKAVKAVAKKIREIDVADLMQREKIYVGKDDTLDYLLAKAALRVLVERYNNQEGINFLWNALEAEINAK